MSVSITATTRSSSAAISSSKSTASPITDLQDLTHVMNNHRSGDTVTIVFYHGKKKQSARVQLDEAKNGTQT